jgi:hypothetical protein
MRARAEEIVSVDDNPANLMSAGNIFSWNRTSSALSYFPSLLVMAED